MNYQIQDESGKQIPSSWVNKVNKTTFSIKPQPSPGDITFFHTDSFMEIGDEIVIYYYQDATNNTHVAECVHLW